MALRASILKTLVYADIFDYPLTRQEIYHWSIGPSSLKTPIHHPKIKSLDSYYFLAGRQKIVSLRQARAHWSQQKLHLATKVGEWLKIIPTIKLVALTGALAMSNSDKHDDIDLMIVTAPHTLWLTRLLVISLISLIAKRRYPGRSALVANRFCLNLWLDTTSLAVPPPKRNLYTAHEVAQVKPLWDRHHTYAHFLSANHWINHYLPNIKIKSTSEVARLSRAQSRETPRMVSWLNRLAFQIQLWYMRPRLTRETVTLHSAFFHPRDTARLVMRQYRHRDSNY